MSDSFSELLERVRRGDEQAARELVVGYESTIRVAVRTRLSDPRLRRQFDSLDICQSVLASFFLHLASGAYELHDSSQLVALLTKMARNKLGMRRRREFRQRRDARRTSPLSIDEAAIKSPLPGPARRLAGRELLERALDLMSAEIREIAERRMRGESWHEIASALGGAADARRKQFSRAIGTIAESLESLNLAFIED